MSRISVSFYRLSIFRPGFLKSWSLDISSFALYHFVLKITSTSIVRIVLHWSFAFIIELRVKHIVDLRISTWIRTWISFTRIHDVKIRRFKNRVLKVFYRLDFLWKDIISGWLVVDVEMVIGWSFLMVWKVWRLYISIRLLNFIVFALVSSKFIFRQIRIVSKPLCPINLQFLPLSILYLSLPCLIRLKKPCFSSKTGRRAINYGFCQRCRPLRWCDWAIA